MTTKIRVLKKYFISLPSTSHIHHNHNHYTDHIHHDNFIDHIHNNHDQFSCALGDDEDDGWRR